MKTGRQQQSKKRFYLGFIKKRLNLEVITLLETAQGRIKMLKAGMTGKEIEQMYIQHSRYELVSVNWQDDTP